MRTCKSRLLTILALVLLSAGCRSTTPTAVPTLAVSSPTLQPVTPTPARALEATASPIPPSPTATEMPLPSLSPSPSPSPTVRPTPAPPTVTWSADGQHAFPVAGDLTQMTWTHFHWDGSNAVDVEAARHLAADSEAFQTFIQLPVVAVVSGTISIADNPYGGLALLLQGKDGYTYYYGHLSEQWVEEGANVGVGDPLGRIGNTGRWTQYIEPHLHFSIATHRADDWRWEPDVNAAEQLLTWFDLPWQDLDIPDYPADQVAGPPLAVPFEITRGFAERRADNPDQGSIDLRPQVADQRPVPVFATLGGEINVNRATVMGLRAQITNRPSRTTVVYSFLQDTVVADGDVVQRGDLIGHVDPDSGFNYMLFVNDVQTDPTPTLDRP